MAIAIGIVRSIGATGTTTATLFIGATAITMAARFIGGIATTIGIGVPRVGTAAGGGERLQAMNVIAEGPRSPPHRGALFCPERRPTSLDVARQLLAPVRRSGPHSTSSALGSEADRPLTYPRRPFFDPSQKSGSHAIACDCGRHCNGTAPSPTTTNGAQKAGWASERLPLSINASIDRRIASARPTSLFAAIVPIAPVMSFTVASE